MKYDAITIFLYTAITIFLYVGITTFLFVPVSVVSQIKMELDGRTEVGFVTDVDFVTPNTLFEATSCIVELSGNNRVMMFGIQCSYLKVGQKICQQNSRKTFIKC